MKKIYLWLGSLALSTGIYAQTTNFAYTGAMQTYTVPAGVTAIRIEVWGAQGQGGNGGQGGYCRGDLNVTPGQVFNVFVGGQAGYNGGGLGWAATPRNGGGASDVRFGGTTLNDRIIVAGGGGSSSGDGNYQGGTGGGGTVGPNYAGGGGGIGYGGNGGPGGASGGTGNTSCHAGGGGGGGYTSGGAPSCNTCYTSTCGQAGTLGQGGNGDTWENGICYNSYGGTSGGGGGYYGGGGSSVGNCGSGGGGGGSSWVGTLSNTVMTGGIRAGNGAAAITELTTAGASLNFDGSNDYVTLGSTMNTTLTSATALTVEAWVYPTTTAGNACIVGNYNTATAQMQFLLRRDGATYTFWTDRGAGWAPVNTGSVVAINTWQHVAGVWNSATQTMQIYLNGVLQNSVTVTGNSLAVTSNPIMIGYNTVNENWAGSIDEVRIWTRALCSSEISNNRNCEVATSGVGLLANYHFNQGISGGANSGVTTLTDASGNGYNGTLANFALTGVTSNWLAPGGVVSGSSCTAFTPPAVTVSSASQTNVSCFGNMDGAASVTATGGSGLTYDWSGTPTGDGTASVTGLMAGSYTCTVTNDCGGTGSFVFTITEPSVLTATATSMNATCFGSCDGMATVTASGGTAPYTYLWSPSASTSASVTGLCAGAYTCTITDANGCTAIVAVTITEPTALVSSSTSSNIMCFGDSATVSVTASGGTMPYTGDGSWMVIAGTYTYTVTDANGCTSSTSITVTEPAQINVTSTQVDVACNGDSTGSVDLTVSGGTAPYTFDWNSGMYTTEDLSGLAAGTYAGVLTDANGCTSSGTTIITEPTALAVTVASTTDPSSCGGSDGAIDLSVSGGTPGYTFLWSNTATTEDLTGVSAGGYNCTITDSNGCSATVNATLNDPTPPTVNLAITADTVCADDGSFTLTGGSPAGGTYSGTAVTGGTFDPGAATAGVNVITYTYTDSSGCTGTATDNIYVDACTGLGADLTNASFSIMPNPNNGQFQFVHNGTTAVDVLVYDAIGQLVTTYKVNAGVQQQINLEAAGMYTITVVGADGSRSSQRVIVNK